MNRYNLTINGKNIDVTVVSKVGSTINFMIDEREYCVTVTPDFAKHPDSAQFTEVRQQPIQSTTTLADKNLILAPMPGIIAEILVSEGALVKAGQALLVLEAMKMENNITAPRDGKIKKILVNPKQEVENRRSLIELE